MGDTNDVIESFAPYPDGPSVRIFVFTQFFPPEVGATQARLGSFVRHLAEQGHEVEVICEVPNHPQGVVHEGFRGRALVRRRVEGLRVHHVWVATSRTKTTRTRIAFYGSYALAATLVGFALPRPDVVLASSPPLPVAAVGAAVARRHRVPWVMDVRDLWPEAAVALGELTDPRALAFAEGLERWLYRDATSIIGVTEPFLRIIGEKTPDPRKISIISNGTTPLWIEAARIERDRASVQLPEEQFVWTYAGNVGPAQGLDAAVEAAGLLDDRFTLLILGDGPLRSILERQAKQLAPGRVVFRDQVSEEEAARYLRASDALLVSLSDHAVLHSAVPSKVFDYCATGRPVVIAGAGESARLTEEAGAALTVPPADAHALAAAISRLRASPSLVRSLGAAGRTFGAANLRAQGARRLEATLEKARRDGARPIHS